MLAQRQRRWADIDSALPCVLMPEAWEWTVHSTVCRQHLPQEGWGVGDKIRESEKRLLLLNCAGNNVSIWVRSTRPGFRLVWSGSNCVIWGPRQHHSRSDIAHLHMRIAKIKRVGQSARILPIHVKKGVKRGKSTIFFHFRKRQD